jgi:hypothetical protein
MMNHYTSLAQSMKDDSNLFDVKEQFLRFTQSKALLGSKQNLEKM